MGYGDYVHWTAIIRDMYNFINDELIMSKQIERIKQLVKCKRSSLNSIIQIKNLKENTPFLFFIDIHWKGNILNHKQALLIFKNNPYVTTNLSHPNLVFMKIESAGYLKWDNGKISKIFDDMHVVNRYALDLGLKDFRLEGDFHFTDDEKDKVKKYLPNNKFILIEPQNHKNMDSRNMTIDKFQLLVDTVNEKFENSIDIIQISPSKFADKESEYLNNCITYKDTFSYRETILFGKYAELAVVPHGGLSIGLAAVNTTVLAIYPCIHKKIMTTYDSEKVYEVSKNNHYNCFIEKCQKCKSLLQTFNEEEFPKIINDVINLLSTL